MGSTTSSYAVGSHRQAIRAEARADVVLAMERIRAIGSRRGPAVLFAAMSFNSVAVFGFHVLVSRILGPSRYGGLGAILALTLLLPVIGGAVSVSVIGQVVRAPIGCRWNSTGPLRGMVILSAVVCVIGGIGSARLADYLHLTSRVPVFLLLLYWVVVLLGVVQRGLLLGQRRFGPVALSVTAGATLRLVLGVVLARSAGVSGALGAYTLAEAASTAGVSWATFRHRRDGSEEVLRLPVRALALTIAATSGMWVMSGSDGFLARHLLDSLPAGFYLAASTAGSIARWLPYNVTFSAFPSLAREVSERSGARSFFTGLGTVVTIVIAVSTTMMVAPTLVTGILFGSKYKPAASILVLLAISNGAQGITGYLLYHQLASRRRTSLLPWIGVVGEAVGIYWWHRNAVTGRGRGRGLELRAPVNHARGLAPSCPATDRGVATSVSPRWRQHGQTWSYPRARPSCSIRRGVLVATIAPGQAPPVSGAGPPPGLYPFELTWGEFSENG